MTEPARILTGHLEYADLEGFLGEGVDLFLTIYEDDGGREHHTLAVRPGKGNRGITWGPPASLHEEPES
jgi:hypothetical protein